MADKRITDLPLILSGDVSSLDVLPIVNVELDITNKITADQLKAYINSGFTDVYVTGFTYDNANTLSLFDSTGGTFNTTINSFSSLTVTDITGTTFNGGSFNGDGSGLFNLPDVYVDSISFNNSNYLLTITRNDFWSDSVSLSILASDVTITGGTYDSGTGVGTFTNNTGGTFNVTGFLVGYTDTKVTGFTYDNINTFNIYDNSGNTFSASITTLSATTISGGTFYGDGSNLTGIIGGGAEVTGYTYDNANTFTIFDSTGGTFNATINDVTGLTVNGIISATTISGGTLYGDGSNLTGLSTQDTRVTGFTYDDLNNLTIFDSTGGTFSVNVDVMSALTVTNGLSGGTISITNSPSVSISPTYILSRNSLTGEIEFTAYSAITRTIDPFNNIGNASTVTWDVSGTSANYEVTLTANTTLNITNVRNGDYGTIILKQDGVGSRTLTFGTINGTSGTNRHKVSNGGGGNVFLTSNASAVDLLTFAYNGTNLYWTIGNDYT
jgi:hypothetical protein